MPPYIGLVDRQAQEIVGKKGYRRVDLSSIRWGINESNSGGDYCFINLDVISFPIAREHWGEVVAATFNDPFGGDGKLLQSAYVFVGKGCVASFERGRLTLDGIVNGMVIQPLR